MGKSYKHYPVCRHVTKGSKRIANKRVRRLLKNHNLTFMNCDYKRVYPQWEVCEQRYYSYNYLTFANIQRANWHIFHYGNSYPCTEKNIRNNYDRWYRRK